MTKRILIMGLPGSGKTTLAQALIERLDESGKVLAWFNADSVREQYKDWDFSLEGRLRQSRRMRQLADSVLGDYVMCDFVAPLQEQRDIFDADITIWIDTVEHSQYNDTDLVFVKPAVYDFHITEKNSDYWASIIAQRI